MPARSPNAMGSVKTRNLRAIADDAAMRLCEVKHPAMRVVTISPDGRVEIEMANEAAEDDIVGSYDPANHKTPRWIGLSKAIFEDLKHEVSSRGLLREAELAESRD